MQYVVMVLSVLVGFVLQTTVFPSIPTWGLRLDLLMMCAVVYAIYGGRYAGGAMGLVSGLLIDVFFGSAIGVRALPYMLLPMMAGVLHRKYFADNLIVPALAVFLSVLIKELILGLIAMVFRIQTPLPLVLGRYVLPSAALTALVTIPYAMRVKPMYMRQLRRLSKYE